VERKSAGTPGSEFNCSRNDRLNWGRFYALSGILRVYMIRYDTVD